MKLLLIILINNPSRSGVSKLPKVWIPRFALCAYSFRDENCEQKKGISTMFIVLPGYPIPTICQMLLWSSKAGLNIQDWYTIEMYKLRKPYSIKKGTRMQLIK